MNNRYLLNQIREVWINAYLNGEVDWLSYLEAPTFFVKRGDKLIFKSEQISFIERSRAKFPTKKSKGVEFRESIIDMQERKGWATVYGSASFKRNGEIVSQCNFFELWLIIDERWQIASLCIEDANQAAEA
ncbi:hypothetical protein [Cupriavidus sp. PET2-C1]